MQWYSCESSPAALLQPSTLDDTLQEAAPMDYVPLSLYKDIPPGRQEARGNHQTQWGIGIEGGVVFLDMGSERWGLVTLKLFGELQGI